MRRRYRPTRRELQGSHLLHLSGVEVGSGPFSDGLKRSITLCLDSGTTIEQVSSLINRTPDEIHAELKE